MSVVYWEWPPCFRKLGSFSDRRVSPLPTLPIAWKDPPICQAFPSRCSSVPSDPRRCCRVAAGPASDRRQEPHRDRPASSPRHARTRCFFSTTAEIGESHVACADDDDFRPFSGLKHRRTCDPSGGEKSCVHGGVVRSAEVLNYRKRIISFSSVASAAHPPHLHPSLCLFLGGCGQASPSPSLCLPVVSSRLRVASGDWI